eukprot:IDg10041t1
MPSRCAALVEFYVCRLAASQIPICAAIDIPLLLLQAMRVEFECNATRQVTVPAISTIFSAAPCQVEARLARPCVGLTIALLSYRLFHTCSIETHQLNYFVLELNHTHCHRHRHRHRLHHLHRSLQLRYGTRAVGCRLSRLRAFAKAAMQSARAAAAVNHAFVTTATHLRARAPRVRLCTRRASRTRATPRARRARGTMRARGGSEPPPPPP